jgi:DNA polymerase-4
VATAGDLRALGRAALEERFGRWGRRLHELSWGIDEHAVQPDRPTLQVSSEDTFEHDLTLEELEPHIHRLAGKTWAGHQRETGRIARTVVLKLKTADFRTLTRSVSPATPPASAQELAELVCALRARVGRPAGTRYRLVGVGLAGFVDRDHFAAQRDLFETAAPRD